MILKIFDKEENYICNLTNLIAATHEEEVNGKDILKFSIMGDNEKAKHVEKKGRVVYKDRLGLWKEFIIVGITEPHENDGLTMEVYCESSFYELFGDYIDDKRPQNVKASIALGVALEPTRWEIGRVDDLGINSTNFYHTSSKEAVQKVAEVWQGEIRTRITISGNKITHRYVDLLQRRGNDLGKRYEYSKDLISITKTVLNDDVITALYGYGKGEHIEETDGYGRRIDFGDIVWSKAKGDPIDKPKGQKWIGDSNIKEIWGRNNSNGTKAHVFGKVEFDDIEDEEELLQATWEEYKNRSQIQVSYEGKVADFKELEGLEHEGVELGDTVVVIDREFNPELRIKARVISYEEDLLNPANDEIVLGSFMDDITSSTLENKKFIDNFRGKQGVWDRSNVINDNGSINAQYLENLIEEMNEKLNSQGGYVYLSEDGKGITTYDKPIDQNPTKAIQLLGGAFRIANGKKPNGEFNWRTFGDGDGFVADLIVAGILRGGNVEFDLTNGTLNIGNKLIFDGENLTIDFSGTPIEADITDLQGDMDNVQKTADELRVGVDDYKSGKLSGVTYKFDGKSFNIGGANGDIVEHSNQKSKYRHSDGSYTEISSKGLERYDSGTGHSYHYMTKVIKFAIGGTNGPSENKWIPLGPEFNNKKWAVALSISDSMVASSAQAAIQRIVLTQGHDSNNKPIKPRFRNKQWEYPVMGYKTNYNPKNDSRKHGKIAGIMIVTA